MPKSLPAARTLGSLRDDAIVAVFARVPLASHDACRCVCRRFARLGERASLARHRAAAGWTEEAVVVAGGGPACYQGVGEPAPDNEETWALISGRWRALAPQPAPRCDACVVRWRGMMVCAGATVTSRVGGRMRMVTGVSELVAYDAVADRWRDLGEGPEARTGGAAVVDPLTGALVVLGGWVVPDSPSSDFSNEGARAVPSMQALDAVGGAWRRLAPLPQAVSNFAAAVMGDKLYVAGGLRWEANERRDPSRELQIYDFRADAWSFGPRLPAAQYYGDGACLDGRLYVVGGKDARRELTTATHVFDPESMRWTAGPRLPAPRFYHAARAHGRRLLVVGGNAAPAGEPLVLVGDAWLPWRRVLPPLPAPEGDLLAALVAVVPVG